MEESLTVDELFILYRASNAAFSMDMKVMAASQGAEVDWEEDWYNPPPPKPIEVIESADARFLPIGLGFESA